jgi:DNA-binding MarR family transcriptional regulator
MHKIMVLLTKDSMKDVDVSPNECQLFMYLSNSHIEPTATKFSEFAHIVRPNVSRMVEKLRKNGYIKVEYSQTDKRSQRLVLMDKSEKILELIEISLKNFLGVLTEGFSAEEHAELQTLIKKMDANLDKYNS